MPKYWIIPVTREYLQIVKRTNIYGVPETRISGLARDLIRPEIIIMFYIKKKGSWNLGGKFVGAFKVVSERYRETRPLWPDEAREDKVKYPWRIKFESIKLGIANFKSLVLKLEFIKRKEMPNTYFVETPVNLRKPIPEHDTREIVDALS